MQPSMSRRSALLSFAGAACVGLAACARAPVAVLDPLPSWNDGAAKRAVLHFAEAVGGADGMPADERIAVFDNDGTLWTEQPIYIEAQFTLDRARQMLRDEPSLAANPPFAALASAGDGMPSLDAQALGALAMATHANNEPEAMEAQVRTWLETARHPRFGVPYTQCIYQPMLEVLRLLRSRQFKTFIVSGGGVDFIRAFAEATYGVPPEQVIGSSGGYHYEMRGGAGVVMKTPEPGSVDDGAGKPQNIALHIGRRPLAAFGNSDGDLEMLQYVSTGSGARLALLVHHDDASREYAYDRNSEVGRLSVALDEAAQRGWTVVSMKEDWRTIFPPAPRGPGI
jgi:phosphoglycolate phosphatase-like HAD superfamily hydrolase